MKLFLGSNNLSKIADWKSYFEREFEIVTPDELSIKRDIQEVEYSLEENAILKAREWAKASNLITLSDDSGFYITELGNMPGVITKRWLESQDIRGDKLINFIDKLNNKECYFRSVTAIASPDGNVYTFKYEAKGKLVKTVGNKINIDLDYSLGNYFKHDDASKAWSEMNSDERKWADSNLIKEVKTLISKLCSYSEIVTDINNGPKKIKLGFPTSKPDQLAVDVFSFASSLQPNNCGMLTNKKDHKNPFKVHEVKAISRLGEFMGDADIDGYISSGATESNLMAMWIAREKLKNQGINITEIVVLKSKLSHYSVSKAANILNLTEVEDIELDNELSMNVFILKERIKNLCNSGKGVIIMSTSGYNVTGSSDKFIEINQIVDNLPVIIKHRVFFHIDAATLGFISPFINEKYKYLKYGNVGSIAIDGHKLGLIPYPCGLFMVRKGLSSNVCNDVDYLGTQDQTFLGSRTGASASALWAILNGPGVEFYRNNSQLCISYKNYLVNSIKKKFPNSIILNYDESNILGILFVEMPSNRLPKYIEDKYSLHPTLVSLRNNETPRYYYQVVVTPEIDLLTIDTFIKDISINSK